MANKTMHNSGGGAPKVPVPTEVTAGKPYFQEGLLRFEGAYHPKLAVGANFSDAERIAAQHELRALQAAKIKNVNLEKLPGYSKDGVEIFHNQITASKPFGILRTGGIGAALKNNFGAEAREASTLKVAFKGAGVLVGLGAIGDAAFRSKKTGPDGQVEERSWVSRVAEGTAGLGIAAASALHGRR